MEELKTGETAREKLEDAAVAVFMEEYARALNAGIDQQMEETADEEFPPELEERCLELIRQDYIKQRKQKQAKKTLRVLRNVAAVLVLCLSISSALFITVEAVRTPIINFFVEKTDRYWQLSGESSDGVVQCVFDPEDPLRGIISDEFLLIELVGSWETGTIIAEYNNGESTTVNLVMNQSTGNLQIDSENSNMVPYKVQEHDALKSVEGNRVRITWLDETNEKIFTINATNVNEEMVEVYADTLAECLG